MAPDSAAMRADLEFLTPATPQDMPGEKVVEQLCSNIDCGLSTKEAVRRLQTFGPNELAPPRPRPWWLRLLAQLSSVLVIILLLATAISLVEWLLQHPRETALPYDAIIIFAIVVLNALLGLFQEKRAELAVEALASLSVPEALVVRDGIRMRVRAREIVPGDIVLVSAGDNVVADARLLDAASLRADESALTGESVPVAKRTEAVGHDALLAERSNMLFSGTVVTAGRGRAIVTATGMATEVGRIARLIAEAKRDPTPLEEELDRTGRRLSFVMLGICAVVTLTGLAVTASTDLKTILSLFLFAVALAVAAIPEALPAIVTLALSLGVRRMAAVNAIVKKLPAVETLGAATVICTDKTGTLTRNEMTVKVLHTSGTRIDIGGSGYSPEGNLTVAGLPLAEEGVIRESAASTLRAAALANDATVVFRNQRWQVEGDPTDGALIVAARKIGIATAELSSFRRIDELPFSEQSKRHTTVHADPSDPGQLHVFVKGAPEVIFSRCSGIVKDGRVVPMDDERRREVTTVAAGLAGEALRVLAIACRQIPLSSRGTATASSDTSARILDEDLVLLGLVGMIDPPRPEAKAAVATAKHAHIRVVMVTGDHPATASAIARELDILEPGSLTVSGVELQRLPEVELEAIIERARVFARVDPEQKLRIVETLQRRGHVVAMTGDGVNDAPALRRADIGIAMGRSGTDVSRGAADMVLADDNFATIVRAVQEGRGIFANIRKYLIYLLSSNAGEILTMFAGVMFASLLGLVPPDSGLFLPLLASQLLWINLVTDGPPALALGIDPNEPATMQMAPRQRDAGILNSSDWLRILGTGVVMMIGTLAVLDAYYPGGLLSPLAIASAPNAFDETRARTMALTTLILFQLVNVYNCRSATRSALQGVFENRWLFIAVLVSLGAHFAILYVPWLQTAFRTMALTPEDWFVAASVAATLVVASETAKFLLRMRSS